MKNLMVVFSLFLCLSSFAQENGEEKKVQNDPEFTSEQITFKADKNLIELSGNVNFKTDIMELTGADKIVYNPTTNEIVVTGLKDFVIDGVIQITGKADGQMLKYTIGERVAYVE